MRIEILSTKDEGDDHLLTLDLEDVSQEDAKAMIREHLAVRSFATGEKHGAYSIVDCQDGPEGLSEYDISKAFTVQAVMSETHIDDAAVTAWCELVGLDQVPEDGEKAEALFHEAYRGEHSSQAAFAEAEHDGVWDIPDHLQSYINWEGVGDSLLTQGGYSEHDGHYFRDC